MSTSGIRRGAAGGLFDPGALDHRSTGARYVMSALFFFVIAGLLGLLMRAQLALPQQEWLGPADFHGAFALHGTLMLAAFLVPAVLGAGLWLLPPMLEAGELPLPRLAAFGSWCHLFAGAVLLGGVAWGGPPLGAWNAPPPLAVAAPAWLAAMALAAVAGLAGGVSLAAAILRGRAPGMRLRDLPLLAWYLLPMAALLLLGLPTLLLACLLLWLEQGWGWAMLDPARGGDPLLWRRLVLPFGWLQSLLVLLPAVGLLVAYLPAYARNTMVMPRWLGVAAAGTLPIAAAAWLHQIAAIELTAWAATALGLTAGFPAGIVIASVIATIGTGRPLLRAPLLFAAGFVAIFLIGGASAIVLALPPLTEATQGTQAVAGLLHLVLWGGAVLPLLGALHHWWPEATGRAASEWAGRIAFGCLFIGTLVGFLPLLALGLQGMPRRVHTYPDGLGWTWPNLVSSGGAALSAVGVLVLLGGLVLTVRRGAEAAAAPTASRSAEARSWVPCGAASCLAIAALGAVAGSPPFIVAGLGACGVAVLVWNRGAGSEGRGDLACWFAICTDAVLFVVLAVTLLRLGGGADVARIPASSAVPILAAAALGAAAIWSVARSSVRRWSLGWLALALTAGVVALGLLVAALYGMPAAQRDAGSAMARLLVLHQVFALGIAVAATLPALWRGWRARTEPRREPALRIARRFWGAATLLWLLALPLLLDLP